MAIEQHHSVAQFDGTPRRRFYTGGDIKRVEVIADLRARTHKLMPRFVLEYLEGGQARKPRWRASANASPNGG